MQTLQLLHLKIFNYLDQISQKKKWVENHRRRDNTLFDEMVELIINDAFSSCHCEFIVGLGNIEELLNEHEMVFLNDQFSDKKEGSKQQVMFNYIISYLFSNFEYIKTRVSYFMNHVDKVSKIHSLAKQLLEKTSSDIQFSKWVSHGNIFNNENTRRIKYPKVEKKENNNTTFNFAERCVNNNLSFETILNNYDYSMKLQLK